jgi:hypothetical protein
MPRDYHVEGALPKRPGVHEMLYEANKKKLVFD